MKLLGPNELVENVLQKGLCVGCGACVNLCPYFAAYRGKIAITFPCTMEKGRCFAHCPKIEVDLHDLADTVFNEPYRGSPMGEYRRIVTARAGKKAPSGLFQCGGTVSALMAFALQSKAIDAAVLTGGDGLDTKPALVRDPAEVARFGTSKYMASPTLAAMNAAAREGVTRMGVVATPCQAMAIAQMRANPLKRPDFVNPVSLVVGLFCTWALDTRKLAALIAQETGLTEVRKMDLPPPPSEIMVLETDKGRVEIPLSKIRPLVPKGCAICPDMTSEWADVSVGVLEGEPELNTLVIRTQAGDDLVEKAREAGFIKTGRMPKDSLNHLMGASQNKKKRAVTEAMSRGALNAEKDGEACLRVSQKVLQRILE